MGRWERAAFSVVGVLAADVFVEGAVGVIFFAVVDFSVDGDVTEIGFSSYGEKLDVDLIE